MSAGITGRRWLLDPPAGRDQHRGDAVSRIDLGTSRRSGLRSRGCVGMRVYPHTSGLWVWRHGSSTTPRVRQPILLGALLVVLGASATVGLVYTLNLRRTRKLSKNTEDIHGSARWATADDCAPGAARQPTRRVRGRVVRRRGPAAALSTPRWAGARAGVGADAQWKGCGSRYSHPHGLVRILRCL